MNKYKKFSKVKGYAFPYGGCVGKIKYSTITKAKKAEEKYSIKHNKLMRAYLCASCKGYHLSSKESIYGNS